MTAALIAALDAARAGIDAAYAIARAAPVAAPAIFKPPAASPAPAAPDIEARRLRNPGAFFAHVRAGKLLGPTLSEGEVGGCDAILKACEGWARSWAAYGLGTAYLETAGTMQPIKEHGGPAYFTRMYDITGARPEKARELGNLTPGDGPRYAGRGYVQLTGRANYLKAEQKLGVPFSSDPDLALAPQHAAAIMRQGMSEGWFTGRTLRQYLPAAPTRDQYEAARQIINGRDRDDDVAGYAIAFAEALAQGEWE